MTGPDRGLARALASTVLRRQGAIDHVVGAYVDRPLPKRAQRGMDILRLAAAQSLLFGTPAHATVSTSVALAKQVRETESYAGLINAVARKIAAAGPEALAGLPARVDTPGWMWRTWERSYGPDAARAIATAHQREAPLDLTPKDPAVTSQLAETLGGSVVLGRTVRLQGKRDVAALAGFETGEFWVQDAAAALPARLLGDVAGLVVYDLCAAPGGKTMQLAAAGAKVTAVDVSGHRLKRMQDNLTRVRLEAETVKTDVREFAPKSLADAILLDAPCTATGTVRRRPDVLRTKSEDDLKALTIVQRTLLDRAADLLKPGGLLVYATCSLQPEEGEAQIEAALARRPDLKREPIGADEVPGLAGAVTRAGDLRTTPAMLAAEGGLDGFFAARLRKATSVQAS